MKFVQSLTKYPTTVTHYSVFVARKRVLSHEKFCTIEIEIMGSKWMCLLELNQRIVSIQKN